MIKKEYTKQLVKTLDEFFIARLENYIYKLKDNSTIYLSTFFKCIEETKDYLEDIVFSSLCSLQQKAFVLKAIDLVYETNLKRVERLVA